MTLRAQQANRRMPRRQPRLSEARSRASYHSFLSAGSRTDRRRCALAAGRCACSSLLEDELGERASLDILHRVEVAPVLASDREDWHDVRVVELGRCMRLDAEALQSDRVDRRGPREDFERNPSPSAT